MDVSTVNDVGIALAGAAAVVMFYWIGKNVSNGGGSGTRDGDHGDGKRPPR